MNTLAPLLEVVAIVATIVFGFVTVASQILEMRHRRIQIEIDKLELEKRRKLQSDDEKVPLFE